jgi:hypothetical protein
MPQRNKKKREQLTRTFKIGEVLEGTEVKRRVVTKTTHAVVDSSREKMKR